MWRIENTLKCISKIVKCSLLQPFYAIKKCKKLPTPELMDWFSRVGSHKSEFKSKPAVYDRMILYDFIVLIVIK